MNLANHCAITILYDLKNYKVTKCPYHADEGVQEDLHR